MSTITLRRNSSAHPHRDRVGSSGSVQRNWTNLCVFSILGLAMLGMGVAALYVAYRALWALAAVLL